jgi:uncharacterized caspase-like protein
LTSRPIRSGWPSRTSWPAGGTGDLLLVYLSCHGLVDVRRRLYFAATDTRKDRLGGDWGEADLGL